MWWLEEKTISKEDMGEGFLPHNTLTKLTFITAIILLAIASPLLTSVGFKAYIILLLIPLLARLTALDATYHVLADIYTLPLIVIGLAVAPYMEGQTFLNALYGAGAAFVFTTAFALLAMFLKGGNIGIGGGDIKLITAIGAWVGLWHLPFVLSLAFFLSLAISFSLPRGKPIPMGPGLIAAFWLFLLFGESIYTLIFQS